MGRVARVLFEVREQVTIVLICLCHCDSQGWILELRNVLYINYYADPASCEIETFYMTTTI